MNPPPSIAQLKAECYRLIDVVATRPGAMKLLLGVRNQLLMFSQYKADRSKRFKSCEPYRK